MLRLLPIFVAFLPAAFAQQQQLTPDLSGVQSAVSGLLAIGAGIVAGFTLFKLGKRAANRI